MARDPRRKGFIGLSGTLSTVPDVAKALGELTAAWSFLEHNLAFLLQRVTGLSFQHASAIMYAVNATSARIDIVRTCLERLPEDDPLRIDGCAALRRVVALCGRRNALVHHTWTVDAIENKAYTFDYRAQPDTQARRSTRTAKGILKFCDEVMEVCKLLIPLTDVPWKDTVEEVQALHQELQPRRPARAGPPKGSAPQKKERHSRPPRSSRAKPQSQ
jgi:hypothetical protein